MILRGSVFSKSLMMDTGVTVFVPDGYEKDEPYHITYLLHGVCGNNTDFTDYTMLPVHAAGYRSIIVMPEVHRSFYADMVYGQQFFTYVSEELPSICKRVFRVSSKPEDTSIMGVSMGGYGALKCALAHPGRYRACCALSPGSLYLKDFLREMRDHDQKGTPLSPWGEMLIGDFRAAFGEKFAWSAEIELLELAKHIQNPKDAPRFFATCGGEDDLSGINRQFAQDMEDHGFDYTYEESPGGHDWYFFDTALKRSLEFAFGKKD